MSRIGLGYNINQPMKQCFNCQYWSQDIALPAIVRNKLEENLTVDMY